MLHFAVHGIPSTKFPALRFLEELGSERLASSFLGGDWAVSLRSVTLGAYRQMI